jgi:hypothetical protein
MRQFGIAVDIAVPVERVWQGMSDGLLARMDAVGPQPQAAS